MNDLINRKRSLRVCKAMFRPLLRPLRHELLQFIGITGVAGCLVLTAPVGCGGKKPEATVPSQGGAPTSGSSGTVTSGGELDPRFTDPSVPTPDPNDAPVTPDQVEGGAPTVGPPGLDIPAGERAQRVQAHLQAATAAMQSESNPDQAIAEARAALQIDESSIEAMVVLAHANVVKGYYDLAEDVLLKAFERGGKNNKQAFFLLGLVYDKTGREEKAPTAYQNALVLDPNYKSALMNLGVHHLRAKRYADAVRTFEKLTGTLGVDSPVAWTNLGSSYRGHSASFSGSDATMRNKLILDAEKAYRRAISQDKNYSNAYYNMGLLYLDADPFPTPNGEMERLTRLKNAKKYLDEYRRIPGADLALVDATASVAQKLIDKEELLKKKSAEREAKRQAAEKKRQERAKEQEAKDADKIDGDEGFE